MKVIYVDAGHGWATISVASRLLAELLQAELVVVPLADAGGRLSQLASIAPRRHGREDCLVIAPNPGGLRAVASARQLLRGYRHVAGWVIDSFWDDRIPGIARTKQFDQYFVTDRDDIEAWSSTTGRPVSSVPIGSNTLDLGSATAERPIDVIRLGRQPEQWDDDVEVEAAFRTRGITFTGRPEYHDDPIRNQREVASQLATTKFTLSFSPKHSPADYTHPTREYLTGRWTDASSAGAVVAGIAPVCGSANDLLWSGATLELGTTDREAGLELISEAIRTWGPQQAVANHLMALRRLDLRWRIASIAEAMGITSDRLDTELGRLREAIATAESLSD